MEAATDFYAQQIERHPDASIAREVLEQRQISDATAKRFRLGYAPHGWDALTSFLQETGCSPTDAESVGLIVPRRSGRGHYDRFRHRLMFPITNLHGQVVAFSGRALREAPSMESPKEPPAKYVNSPESPLYRKGEVLYGLHEGRVEIRREDMAVVCEGNFDLVALHQAGFAHAVAPMGTALTEAHAKLLKRFAQKVVLLFDGDAAGRKAAREAHAVFHKLELATYVATLPAGADPDSFVREQGADAMRALLTQAPSIIEYLIDDASASAEASPRSKADAIAKLAPILAGVESPIERRAYVERVARKFGINDVGLVRRELRRGLGGASRANLRRRDAPTRSPKDEVPELQLKLISALIDQPELVQDAETQKLSNLLTSPDLRAIFDTILRMVCKQGSLDAPVLLGELDANSLRPWVEEQLAVQQLSLEDARRVISDGLPRLEQQNIERELPRLQQRIIEARRVGDDTLAAGLTQEFMALSRSAHELKRGSKR